MTDPTLTLLYVDSPAASASFEADLLGKPPVEQSATFALFVLDSGARLGLWSRHTVRPAPTGEPGAGELAFPVDSADAVRTLH
ncbi:MAG: drug:proton antiporter, partial [Microvirgula sp.]